MANLAVWRVDAPQRGEAGKGGRTQLRPQSVERSHIDLEKHLEDWIEADATLIAEGLTIVGRQIRIDDGRLDLLAIDAQDRWVVIEIKAETLDAGALNQALYYAASLARLSIDDLQEKLESSLREADDAAKLSARVKQLLEGEGEQRDIAVWLVGVGISPGLERMKEFLGRFGVPISIVSFQVFALDSGPKLLIREVIEEPTDESARPRRQYTVEAIRQQAVDAGVVAQFDRFVKMSEDAGLAVQPQRTSVRIAPPGNRTRFLMYANPSDGSIGIEVGPKQFAEFFNVSEDEATEALGPYGAGEFLAGEALNERLDQIETFLTEKL